MSAMNALYWSVLIMGVGIAAPSAGRWRVLGPAVACWQIRLDNVLVAGVGKNSIGFFIAVSLG